MQQESLTAAARLPALAELRALLPSVNQPHNHRLLVDAISTHEAELRLDAAELQSLLTQSTTQEVSALLQQQLAAINSALATADAATHVPAPLPAPIDVSEADGKGTSISQDVTGKKKQPVTAAPPAPAPAAATKPPAGTKPLDTAVDAPSAALDPNSWPIASDTSLPAEAWRSAHLPIRAVPRCPYGSKAARTLMEQRKPVVLTDAPVVKSAVGKWDVAYLQKNLTGVPCTVFASHTRHFRYWDEDKNGAAYAFPDGAHTEKLTMSIDDFAKQLSAAARTAEGSAQPSGGCAPSGGACKGEGEKRYYLQTALVEGVGANLMADFKAFDWEGVLALQRRLEWGELTSNLLLVGQAGNTTPAHYDEQQNIFAQIDGTKRCLLFSPADFPALYPFPLHHPHDRQSQVDLYAPDLNRFPRFPEVQPLEAMLSPGDLLYIPQYWWHHIENLSDGCVSLNFWFKDTSKPQKVSAAHAHPLATRCAHPSRLRLPLSRRCCCR